MRYSGPSPEGTTKHRLQNIILRSIFFLSKAASFRTQTIILDENSASPVGFTKPQTVRVPHSGYLCYCSLLFKYLFRKIFCCLFAILLNKKLGTSAEGSF